MQPIGVGFSQMRRRLPWLLALPVMAAGSLAAHSLSYLFVSARASAQDRGRPDSPRSFRRRRDRRSTCRGSRRSRSATRNEDRPGSNGGSAPSDRRTDTEVVSPVVLDPKEVQVRTHMTRLRAALVLLL